MTFKRVDGGKITTTSLLDLLSFSVDSVIDVIRENILELKGDVASLGILHTNDEKIEFGGWYNNAVGQRPIRLDTNDRARYTWTSIKSGSYTFKLDSDEYNFSIGLLDSDGILLRDSGWQSKEYTFSTNENETQFIMTFKRVDGGSVANLSFFELLSFRREVYDEKVLDYSKDIKAISSIDNKIAHACSAIIDNVGNIWTVFYADNEHTTEQPTNNTTKIILARTNIIDINNKVYYEVAKCGDIIGGETIESTYGCYDPAIVMIGNYLYIYFLSSINGKYEYRIRKFNLTTMTLEDSLVKPTITVNDIKYDLCSTDIAMAIYNFSQNNVTVTGFSYPIFMPSYSMYNERYYGTISIFSGISNYYGIIVSTTDYVNFEIVKELPSTHGNNIEIVSTIKDNYMYLACRTDNGSYLHVYDMTTSIFVTEKLLSTMSARLDLKIIGSDIYVLYNLNEPYSDSYGTVSRATLEIDIVKYSDNNINLRKYKRLLNKFGINYPCLSNFYGRLFLFFSSDRRKITSTKDRSEIDVLELN